MADLIPDVEEAAQGELSAPAQVVQYARQQTLAAVPLDQFDQCDTGQKPVIRVFISEPLVRDAVDQFPQLWLDFTARQAPNWRF